MWFQKLVRQFFFMVDSIVYNGISEVYRLLVDISRTSVLSQSSIQTISNRIYQLLAVFMTFKIIFSLIMYVVNPDDFSDKSKGVSKLGLNVVITLSLLVLTPYVFSYAFQLQGIILEDNSLGTLIFGDNDEDSDTDFSVFVSTGDKLAFYTMKPFFIPNASMSALANCTTMEIDGNFNKECSGIDFESEDEEQYTGSSDSLAGLTQDDDNKTNYDLVDVKNYVYGVENENLSLMFRTEMALATSKGKRDKNEFVIDYKFMFSTPIGIIVVLLLISFCLDVALRSVKLAFLQLIAPIPILSYLDPKGGKDGMFKKWYQLCFKTFLSLFVRLLALYFAVYIIAEIGKMSDVITGAYESDMLVKVFVIIGVLMFAKQLPKILEGLGIKLDGDGSFTLNPIKKIGNEALGGKKIMGLGAAGAAAGLAGATNFASRLFHPNSWKNNKGDFSLKSGLKNVGKAPFSALAGTASAFRRGAVKAINDEKMGKVFADSYGEAMFAKVQREDLARKGSTLPGRVIADLNRWTGNLNDAQRQELEYAQIEQEHNARMEGFKSEKEAISRNKAQLAQEKRAQQDIYNKRKIAYEKMQGAIDSFKSPGEVSFTTPDGRTHRAKINVKDSDQYIKDLISNGEYYIKAGQRFTDEFGRSRIATVTDEAQAAAKGYKSEKGLSADRALDEQRNLAYQYLTAEDNETNISKTFKNNQQIVIETFTKDEIDAGKKVSESYGDLKSGSIEAKQAIEKVDSDFYKKEQANEAEEVRIADAEAQENERYIGELKDKNLDKSSAEWKANEADNASRPIKSVQPDGFKPSADVSGNAYSFYNTEFIQGNGPSGGRPHGGGPGGPAGGGPS